jgi:hypothetical protein
VWLRANALIILFLVLPSLERDFLPRLWEVWRTLQYLVTEREVKRLSQCGFEGKEPPLAHVTLCPGRSHLSHRSNSFSGIHWRASVRQVGAQSPWVAREMIVGDITVFNFNCYAYFMSRRKKYWFSIYGTDMKFAS